MGFVTLCLVLLHFQSSHLSLEPFDHLFNIPLFEIPQPSTIDSVVFRQDPQQHLQINRGIRLRAFLWLADVVDVVGEHQRVKLLQGLQFLCDGVVRGKVLGDELVDEGQVQVQVVDRDQGEVFQLLEVLPVEVDDVGHHRIQHLLHKRTPNAPHIRRNLLDIPHQPLHVLGMSLPLDLMVLGIIRRHHQLNLLFDQLPDPASELNDQLRQLLLVGGLASPGVVVLGL